jgi:chromate transport protein ChrA
VAAGALLLESRRRRRRPPPGLATVLVASTIYAHSATLSPTGWVGHAWFYLGFAFPVVMTVLVDARELNAAHPERGRRLVGTLAAILFLITVAGWNLASAGLNPSKSLADSIFIFTRGLSLPFFLTALVAAVVAGAIEMEHAETEPAQPEGGAGIGVGQRPE